MLVSTGATMSHLITIGLPLVSPELTLAPGRRFADLLEEHLGQPVESRAFSYSELTDALADGRVDYAWLPPADAHLLSEHAGVVRLLQAVRGGLPHYHSALIVREDSPITELAHLEGRKLVWVHRRSAAGYLVMAGHLRQQGVPIPVPPTFLGSHGAAVQAVAEGQADAAATYVTAVEGQIRESAWEQLGIEVPLRVLALAGPIPTDTLCAWPGTSRKARERVVTSVLALSGTEAGAEALHKLFGTSTFAPASPARYEAMAAAFDRLR